MPSQKPGWYPDPNDRTAEIYWDGGQWHGRRQRLSTPAQPPPLPSTPVPSGKSPSWLHDRWLPFWRRIDDTRRLFICLAVIGAAALIGIFIAAEPWESEFQEECEAGALERGYNPKTDEFGEVVGACVHYGEQFGHV